MIDDGELEGGAIAPWDHGKPHCRLCGQKHWAREGCTLGGVRVIKEHKDKVLATSMAALGLSRASASTDGTPSAKPPHGKAVKPAATAAKPPRRRKSRAKGKKK